MKNMKQIRKSAFEEAYKLAMAWHGEWKKATAGDRTNPDTRELIDAADKQEARYHDVAMYCHVRGTF
jgi:hypothetical protein